MLHIHNWRTFRDDGYWLYQHCQKCQQRRLKEKSPNLLKGQKPNPAWMEGKSLPIPIGEKGNE